MDKFYTTREIGRVLGVSSITVRRWIAKSKLPVIKLDKEYRVMEKDFNKFIEDRKMKGDKK